MGEAALDQTEAELLEEEAKGLNADVAEGTAGTAGTAAGSPWWFVGGFQLEVSGNAMEILKSYGSF